MTTAPPVSVVIPTFNGAATLTDVLDAIAAQEVSFPVETVAIDSGSTDGTVDIIRGRVDRLLEIPPADFNHGGTRNLGIEATSGELVVLLVQDAVPATSTWLTELTAPFAGDPSIAGAFARQLPRVDASRLTRWSLSRWIASQSEPRTSRIDNPEAYSALSPMDRFSISVFDNVCSCVRRSVWQEIPFQATPIAEDVAWGRAVLLAGHGIAYVPTATVLHSHERSLAYELRRTTVSHRRLNELFGLRTVPSLGALLRSIVCTFGDHRRALASEDGPRPGVCGAARSMGLAVIWPLGQYLGGRKMSTID